MRKNELFDQIIDEDDLAAALLDLVLAKEEDLMKGYYPQIIESEIFYPPIIYKYADDEIADSLIQLIPKQEDDIVSMAHLLSCLAWIGTQKVVDFFVYAEKDQPEWSQDLFLPVCDYTLEAGWCIENKLKRNLYNELDSRLATSAVEQLATSCPVCKSHLVTMLKFNPSANSPITPFNTCLLCSCYFPVYMKLDAENVAYWHEKNVPEEYDELNIERTEPIHNAIELTTDITPLPDTTLEFPEREQSHIGGYPAWIQEPAYLSCPDCERKMSYVAQVNYSEFMAYGEGIYYFHYCDHCRVTASNFQQV